MTTLYRLDPKDKRLEPVAKTTYTELQLKERGDIQEWVKKDPGLLLPDGEDLLLITSEFDGFDKTRERLDVLAMDKSGRLVVIELKRDSSSTAAHLQAVGYAAYVSAFSFDDVVGIYAQFQRSQGRTEEDAVFQKDVTDFIERENEAEEWTANPRLVVAAGSFRAEVLATCQWLRSHKIDVSCVQISPYRLGDDILVHVSTLIPLPEEDTVLIRRREVGRRPRTEGVRTRRTEAWWRSENPKRSEEFFKVLDRFGGWAKQAGLDTEVNWSANSYVGFWVGGRCVAPFWPQKTGAAVYLPDESPDGAEGNPSSFFMDQKEALAGLGLKAAWAWTYNRGANPVRVAVTPAAFDTPELISLFAKTIQP